MLPFGDWSLLEEGEEERSAREKKEKAKRTSGLSLDRYCVKYTSEDNHNFQKLHEFTENKKMEKYAHLYLQQKEGDRRCDPTKDLAIKGTIFSLCASMVSFAISLITSSE